MGSVGSRRKKSKTSSPSSASTSGRSGVNRPGAPSYTGAGNVSATNRDSDAQRQLIQANQTIANLNNHIQALQGSRVGGPPISYSGFPSQGASPQPAPYRNPSPFGQVPPYAPASSGLQRFDGGLPFPYPQQPQIGINVYRDTDFEAIAKIAGLDTANVALLHQEFLKLTRGGTVKMDRSIFRQILQDVLFQANNENVDHSIETVFRIIDRNKDGFIDFPEFVGAFKDVLKDGGAMFRSNFAESDTPNNLTQALLSSGVGSGVASPPISSVQQLQQATQLGSSGGLNIVPLESTGIQRIPVICGGSSCVPSTQLSNATPPLITFDPNRSSSVIATPGQYLITQPTALQCIPLPMV